MRSFCLFTIVYENHAMQIKRFKPVNYPRHLNMIDYHRKFIKYIPRKRNNLNTIDEPGDELKHEDM